MTGSVLADAFGHHGWASIQTVDACLALDPAQLDSSVPGTYGSILDTLRHLLEADSSYLAVLSRGRIAPIDATGLSVRELRPIAAANAAAWSELVAGQIDPDELLVRHRPDGSESHAPAGVRLAQALHHGSDHRSQVCTALTVLGFEPPAIDVWDYARGRARLIEVPAPA